MRKTIIAAVSAAFLGAAGQAAAAEKKTVTFFKETCGICHGENGEGTPGLAPAFKGNAWLKGASDGEIATTITKGREGAAKRHKDIPGPMPANSMSDGRLKDVIAYLREIQ
ncbi:MAG TPA: cytochrome c [Usitatibacter sp.]|nr:cytochrome c [Usitatibacter sp.]